jgi:hypothetical protein
MADSFLGRTNIELQAEDLKVPYSFTFTVCSSLSSNDGHLPYGTNISSVAVTAYNQNGVTTSSLISGTPSVTNNVVTVKLNWPGIAGNYKLTFVVTLDNGDASKLEADFTKIYAISI